MSVGFIVSDSTASKSSTSISVVSMSPSISRTDAVPSRSEKSSLSSFLRSLDGIRTLGDRRRSTSAIIYLWDDGHRKYVNISVTVVLKLVQCRLQYFLCDFSRSCRTPMHTLLGVRCAPCDCALCLISVPPSFTASIPTNIFTTCSACGNAVADTDMCTALFLAILPAVPF